MKIPTLQTVPAPRRGCALCSFLLALCALGTACALRPMDQVEVPGTHQRLVVGDDGLPFKKVWVCEDGKIKDVKIVQVQR